MIKDEEIRDASHERFVRLAKLKFDAGIKEHNPDGTKGLDRMTANELLVCFEEEVIDQWHYLFVLRRKVIDLMVENQRLRDYIEEQDTNE
tara:strand:- start:131 stop:400 length:270 start_codon:yes stop_codon:yes gene_type:complete